MKKIDFNGVLESLKIYLGNKHGYKNYKNVSDKFVAEQIGMTKDAFGMAKKRGKLPYEAILDFCANENVDPIGIFYNKRA